MAGRCDLSAYATTSHPTAENCNKAMFHRKVIVQTLFLGFHVGLQKGGNLYICPWTQRKPLFFKFFMDEMKGLHASVIICL